MRKIILIFSIIIAVVLIVFGGYYLRSRNESPVPPTTSGSGNLPTVQLPRTTGNGNGSGQPSVPVQNLNVSAGTSALAYFVDAKNGVTFVQPDGQILKTGANGNESLSAGVIKNISGASFSFDGKKVLVVMRGSAGDQASVFDTERKTWQPLPQNASGPVWSPNNYQIAYFSGVSNGSVLSSIDEVSATPKPKVLLPFYQEDMTLNWLSPNQILIADKTSALWSSSLWSFDLVKKIISPIIQDQPGLETVWSSSSAPFGLMFSANQNQEGGQLRLIDRTGRSLKQLSFITLPSKCVFYDKPISAPTQPFNAATSTSFDLAQDKSLRTSQSGSASSTTTSTKGVASAITPKTQLMLICAVPRDQQRLNIVPLPDAYQEKALYTSDDFFEINVSDGNVKTVFSDSTKNLDASDLKIFNQNLFFINRFDKKVYSVPL